MSLVQQVTHIKVRGSNEGGQRRKLEGAPREVRTGFRDRTAGVDYTYIDNQGRHRVFSGRRTDMPAFVADHVLNPGLVDQEYVGLSDLAWATQHLNALEQEHGVVSRHSKKAPEPKALRWSKLPFDVNVHAPMLVAQIDRNGNWGSVPIDQAVFPFQHLTLSPFANVFHYGQACFEGVKAYRRADGSIVIFRPDRNAARMASSAKRLAMTPVTKEFFMDAIVAAVKANQHLVPPYGTGAALYIRPTQIGSGEVLGVKPAGKEMFFVLVSPVGPYFKTGFKPITLEIRLDYHRSGAGLTGCDKVAGNYAVTLLPTMETKAKGHSEILWLDVTNAMPEEAGSANFAWVKNGEIYTRGLNCGTILPGVTRDSNFTFAEALGIKVHEGDFHILEALTADEAFGTGTAVVVCPVGGLAYDGRTFVLNRGKVGPVTSKLYEGVTAFQRGDRNNPVLLEIERRNSGLLDRLEKEWIYSLAA
ncbi:branched-chain-amino-acid transaminase [candidate division WOR-1 bacterium RIFOXYB2_FULL_42_35]|uniref:branched-chain-amino-acid transaminase n=1 Tax=candidate division WOR-1 bacterium RIFOXYC2_FULL_41_25 TaxID=1802586 RepID=A0A1F4TMA5_UNCSA|nr:MAG: branched-chain-amino-acid transaminase [candidate division WOR-1 bacterium RIFOXYA2_FULL_41_14]OGC22465.1 MAG: branched-chain-amino-acid transaminase [candidate division WOR-1 bacterium RIFOXYB2_FULL_42_35]OGC33203.1 MAG: branched-chain-amino-acid transaminase [candidate division WOR-1 bacterium RIFOXYC2_FULL_41_25]